MSRSALAVALTALVALPVLTGCPSSGGPSLSVYPGAFDFGSTSTTDALKVANQGTGSCAWEIDSAPAWLQVSPTSGVVDSGGQTLTLTVNRSGLAPGNYAGDLVVGSPAGARTVAVSMVVEGPPAAPVLQVSPLTLDMGETDLSEPFTIRNTGDGTLEWNLTEDVPWLTCSVNSGTVLGGNDSDTVNVTVDRSALAGGEHSGDIAITSNGGSATVTVVVTVAGPAPVLSVSPLSLDFGSTATSRAITISNSGNAPLEWSLVESLDWLSLSDTAGVLDSGSVVVTATADRANLPAASYPGQIALASNGGAATIHVGMTVAPASLVVNPPVMQFGSYATTKLLAIGNDGSGTVNWSIDDTNFPGWLSVDPTSGSVTGPSTGVIVTVDRTGLEPANFTHTFTVASDGGNREVQIQMTVPATPVLTIETGLFGSDGQPLVPLGDKGTSTTFTIRNSGTGALDWNIDPTTLPAWLAISPVAGSITTGESLVTVTVNRTGLDAGGFTHDVPIVSNGGNGSIEVTMQVPLRPAISVDPSAIKFGLEGKNDVTFVANTGDPGTLLNFTVESDKPWLFFSPATGTSVGVAGPLKDWKQISVAVDRGGLESAGATGTLTVRAVDTTGKVIPEIPPATVTVSVEASPLTFEAAQARTRIPSMVRFVYIMRDFRDRAIPMAPVDLMDAFQIFEDGVLLEASETNQFVTSADKLRTNVILMFDYSGSMLETVQALGLSGGDPLQELYEQIGHEFIDSLPAPWQLSLMEFHDRNDHPRVIRDFTTDRNALHQALDNHVVTDHGASETLLAMLDAAQHFLNEDNRLIAFDDADVRALVVITDGRITTPPGEIDQAIRDLQSTFVRVFPVGWGLSVNSEPLARIAHQTGGHYYPTSKNLTTQLPTVEDLQQKMRTVSSDLRAQVVLSYTTLNESDGVEVRINGVLNPDDTPDQGILQGTFSQDHDFAGIAGDVKMGQVSMRSSGVENGAARVYIRAEYIPRNVNKCEFTFIALGQGGEVPFTVSKVPNDDGGIAEDWTLTDLGNGSYRLEAPSPLAVLPYGCFGELLQVDFDGIAQTPVGFYLTVHNDIYATDIEPKYFVHSDYMSLDEESALAPAFPALLLDPYTIHFGDNLPSADLRIINFGGSYPSGHVDAPVQLFWQVTELPPWLSIDIEDGKQATSDGADVVTLTPDRSVEPGVYAGYIAVTFTSLPYLAVGGVQSAFVTLVVNPPVLEVTPNPLEIGTEDFAEFTIQNAGQSTLAWSLATDPLPAWLVVMPKSGEVKGQPVNVGVTVKRDGLAPGDYSQVLRIESNGGSTDLLVTMTVP